MNLRILCCLLAILIWPKPLLSQLAGNATLVLFPGAPTGNCNSRQLALDQSSGSLYTCINAAGTNQGTWQIVAGGGGPGGGGWNPPAVSGDTIFGNNTVATSVPSFFTPSGDVSFSAGSFSVNRLHFGPNALSLTNTGIATGNCLQVSGSNIIGGTCGTGTSGGLSGSGTVNLVPKFTAATALGNSLLTDDGTTLTYTGSGGIVTPKFTITQGPFYLESVIGALPALPGAGKNGLTSGPDGWYFSNNNSAWALMGTGGSVGTAGVSSFAGRTGAVSPQASDYSAFFAPIGSVAAGVSSFNSRTGAVNSQPGDYDVTMVSGAAPVASPALTGTPTSTPGPATADSSNQLATTAWVKSQGYISTGPPPATSITQSQQAPVCGGASVSTTNTVTISSGVNIVAGDTVVVLVMIRGISGVVINVRSDVVDSAGNTYTQQAHADQINSTTGARNIVATAPGAALAANSVTINNVYASNGNVFNSIFAACVLTYRGVSGYGNNAVTSSASTVNAATLSLATQDPNNIMVGIFGMNITGGWTATSTVSPGNKVIEYSAGNQYHTLACSNTSPTAAPTSCTWTFTGTAYQPAGLALELRCCAGAGGGGGSTVIPGLFPQVMAYKKAVVTVTTTPFRDVAFMTCSATNCPAGYYRIAWDFLSLTTCTGGYLNINVGYFDEFDLNNAYRTGMISGSGAQIGTNRNHVFGSRLMTVAKALNSTTGIEITTSADSGVTTPPSSSECSSGTGTAQVAITVERLQ